MTQQREQTDAVSFVLRLWLEPTTKGSPDWRWKAHHVQTGEERYFSHLADVLDFVAACSQAPPPVLSDAGKRSDAIKTRKQGDVQKTEFPELKP